MATGNFKVDRLATLEVEIATELGNGVLNDNKLREFRFLHLNIANAEKGGLRYTLQDLESFAMTVRREQSLNAGTSKVQRRNIAWNRADNLS